MKTVDCQNNPHFKVLTTVNDVIAEINDNWGDMYAKFEVSLIYCGIYGKLILVVQSYVNHIIVEDSGAAGFGFKQCTSTFMY